MATGLPPIGLLNNLLDGLKGTVDDKEKANTAINNTGGHLIDSKVFEDNSLSKEFSEFQYSHFGEQQFHPLKTPRRPMLFDHFITDDNLDIGTTLKLGDAYIPVVAIRDFPMETYPAMLSALNGSHIEYRWAMRWISSNSFSRNVGNTTLRAQLPNGKYADCIVSVSSVAEITLDTMTIHVNLGYTETVSYKTNPEAAQISWIA